MRGVRGMIFWTLLCHCLDALVAIKGGPVEESEKDDEEVREAKDSALNICDENFENVKLPRAEVERGFRFWDAVRSRAYILSSIVH